MIPGLCYAHKILLTTINMTNVSEKHMLHYLESHKHTCTLRRHKCGTHQQNTPGEFHWCSIYKKQKPLQLTRQLSIAQAPSVWAYISKSCWAENISVFHQQCKCLRCQICLKLSHYTTIALILGHKNKTSGHKVVFNICGNVSDVKGHSGGGCDAKQAFEFHFQLVWHQKTMSGITKSQNSTCHTLPVISSRTTCR